MKRLGLWGLICLSAVFWTGCGSDNDESVPLGSEATTELPPVDAAEDEGSIWSSATLSDPEMSVLAPDNLATPGTSCGFRHIFVANEGGAARVYVNCEYDWTLSMTAGEAAALASALSSVTIEEARSERVCRPAGASDLRVRLVVKSDSGRSYTLWDATSGDQVCVVGDQVDIGLLLQVLNSLRSKYNSPAVQNAG